MNMEERVKERRRSVKRRVSVSRENKILFPESGITKGDLIGYYQEISDVFVRHARNRPVSLHRFPSGIDGKDIFQKNIPGYFPGWIPVVETPKKNGSLKMTMINNRDTLVYLANQAAIVYHTWLSQGDNLHHPDRMIIDLDPEAGDFELAKKAALKLMDIYDALQLPCFLMLTGSKGLHIATPLAKKESFDEVKEFARELCQYMAAKCPQETTIEIRKEKRKGRVFLDYLRNAYAQTAVAPYSVRANEYAPVAAPIFCEELEQRDIGPRIFTIRNLRQRLDKKGDPWENFNKRGIILSKRRAKLMEISEAKHT